MSKSSFQRIKDMQADEVVTIVTQAAQRRFQRGRVFVKIAGDDHQRTRRNNFRQRFQRASQGGVPLR